MKKITTTTTTVPVRGPAKRRKKKSSASAAPMAPVTVHVNNGGGGGGSAFRRRDAVSMPSQTFTVDRVARAFADSRIMSSEMVGREGQTRASDPRCLIPRALGTSVYPLQTTRVVTKSLPTATSLEVDLRPDLDNALTLTYAQTHTAVLASVSYDDEFVALKATTTLASCTFAKKLDLLDGTKISPIIIDRAGSTVLWYKSTQNREWFEIEEGKVALYPGVITSYGTSALYYDAEGATGQLNYVSYDGAFAIISSQTGAASAALLANPAAIPTPSVYFSVGLSSIANDAFSVRGTCAAVMDVVAQTSEVIAPLDDPIYSAILSSAQGISITGASVRCTCTTNYSWKGGQIAVASLPQGAVTELPSIPQNRFNYLTSLTTQQYSGSLLNGAHALYFPNQVSQLFFTDPGVNRVFGPTLHVVAIPQDMTGTYPNSSNTFYIRFTFDIEVLTTSPALSKYISPPVGPHWDAFTRFMQENQNSLVGENPSHLSRMKSLVNKAAKDPVIRSSISSLIAAGGQTLMKVLPLLLA